MKMQEIDKAWVNRLLNKMTDKLSWVSDAVGGVFPYTTTNGKYEDFAYGKTEEGNGIFWWTNGFWPGIMWLMYTHTGDDKYKKIAEECENKLDEGFDVFWGLIHDVGFMWLPSAVKNYRVTKCKRSRDRGMHAATILAGRFNITGNFIRAWEHDVPNRAIIDCMMNIPILFWASEVSSDPRFADIAKAHANKTMNNMVRDDGSVAHIAEYDLSSGELLNHPAGQGAFSGSSWSRGQAWGIYGFTQSYMYTGDKAYLNTAKKIANYFIANLDDTYVPDVDFRMWKDDEYKDTTAGAAAASGLIDLSKAVPEGEKAMYLNAAVKIIKGLEAYCNFDEDEQSILQHGVGAYGRAPQSIIYGDYFLLEALLKLSDENTLPW